MDHPIPSKQQLKKDAYYFETLALPGEITSMAVGRFYDPNIETLILAKVCLLSPALRLP